MFEKRTQAPTTGGREIRCPYAALAEYIYIWKRTYHFTYY